jgi:hypothetical protein
MNIDGITVLSQKVEEVTATGDFNMTKFSLFLFGTAIIIFIGWIRFAWVYINKGKLGTVVLAGLAVSIICGLCISVGIIDGTETTTYEANIYSVTINDDVSFREVVDNYNLISRDGEIFVLQEKGPEG